MAIWQLPRRPSYKKPPMKLDGALIVLGVPKGFPPLFAALMHLASAVTKRKATIKVVRFDGVLAREFPTVEVYRYAKQHGMCRTISGVAWPEDFEQRIECWQGAALNAPNDHSDSASHLTLLSKE